MKQLLIVPIAVTTLVSSASAAIVVTAEISAAGSVTNTASPYDGDILTDDLINLGSSTLGTVTPVGSFAFDSNGIWDGVGYSTGGNQSGTSYFSGGDVTFTFSLTGSATGYDIDSITSIAGWYTNAHNHAAQNYEVLISTVTAPTYTALTLTGDVVGGRAFVDDASTSGYATKITIAEGLGGPIATGVTGIQFKIYDDSGASVYHEIDVVGTATAIPEPSTALLVGLGALALLRRRRH